MKVVVESKGDLLEFYSEHLQCVRVLPLQLVAALPLSLALLLDLVERQDVLLLFAGRLPVTALGALKDERKPRLLYVTFQ